MAFRFSISALTASKFTTTKFSILASIASNSSIVAFPAISVSILANSASNCSVLTLSAISISTSVITLPSIPSTASVTFLSTVPSFADGEVKLPVTVALWFLINTVTLSSELISAVVSTGVNKSEPSSLTYIAPLYSTVVPYIVDSLLFLFSSLVILTNWDIKSFDKSTYFTSIIVS